MPAKGQTGWHHSDETRKKISDALKRAHAEGRHTSWTRDNKGTGLVKGFTGSHTEQTKRKISQSRKGKAIGNENAKGHTPHNKGKPHPVHTPEWRARVSESMTGEKHWNWQGGKTAEHIRERHDPKHKEWSLSVLRKDRWTCQQCGYKGRNLVAHHVIPFSESREKRYDVSNGICLCRSCHCEIHKPRLGTGKTKPPKRR